MDYDRDLQQTLDEIRKEQDDQSTRIEKLEKASGQGGGISRQRLIVYLVATLFMGSAVYIYYATIVSMFSM